MAQGNIDRAIDTLDRTIAGSLLDRADHVAAMEALNIMRLVVTELERLRAAQNNKPAAAKKPEEVPDG